MNTTDIKVSNYAEIIDKLQAKLEAQNRLNKLYESKLAEADGRHGRTIEEKGRLNDLYNVSKENTIPRSQFEKHLALHETLKRKHDAAMKKNMTELLSHRGNAAELEARMQSMVQNYEDSIMGLQEDNVTLQEQNKALKMRFFPAGAPSQDYAPRSSPYGEADEHYQNLIGTHKDEINRLSGKLNEQLSTIRSHEKKCRIAEANSAKSDYANAALQKKHDQLAKRHAALTLKHKQQGDATLSKILDHRGTIAQQDQAIRTTVRNYEKRIGELEEIILNHQKEIKSKNDELMYLQNGNDTMAGQIGENMDTIANHEAAILKMTQAKVISGTATSYERRTIDTHKRNLQAAEAKHAASIQSHLAIINNHKISLVEKEKAMAQMVADYEGKIAKLETYIMDHQATIEKNENTMERYKSATDASSESLTNVTNDLEMTNREKEQLATKLNSLLEDHNALQKAHRKKEMELASHQDKQSSLNMKLLEQEKIHRALKSNHASHAKAQFDMICKHEGTIAEQDARVKQIVTEYENKQCRLEEELLVAQGDLTDVEVRAHKFEAQLMELNSHKQQINQMNKTIAGLHKNCAGHKSIARTHETNVKKLQTTVDKLNSDLQYVSLAHEALQETHADYVSEYMALMDKYSSSDLDYTEKIRVLKEEHQNMMNEVRNMMEGQESELSGHKSDSFALQKEHDRLKQMLEQHKNDLNVINEKHTFTRQQVQDHKMELDICREQIEHHQNNYENMKATHDSNTRRYSEDIGLQRERIDILTESKRDGDRQLMALTKEHIEARNGLKSELFEHQTNLQVQKQLLSHHQTLTGTLQSQINGLKDTNNGYQNEIFEWKNKHGKVVGGHNRKVSKLESQLAAMARKVQGAEESKDKLKQLHSRQLDFVNRQLASHKISAEEAKAAKNELRAKWVESKNRHTMELNDHNSTKAFLAQHEEDLASANSELDDLRRQMSDKDQLIRQHESSIRGHVQFSRMSGGNSDGQKERAMKFQKMHAALEKKHQTHVAESMKDLCNHKLTIAQQEAKIRDMLMKYENKIEVLQETVLEKEDRISDLVAAESEVNERLMSSEGIIRDQEGTIDNHAKKLLELSSTHEMTKAELANHKKELTKLGSELTDNVSKLMSHDTELSKARNEAMKNGNASAKLKEEMRLQKLKHEALYAQSQVSIQAHLDVINNHSGTQAEYEQRVKKMVSDYESKIERLEAFVSDHQRQIEAYESHKSEFNNIIKQKDRALQLHKDGQNRKDLQISKLRTQIDGHNFMIKKHVETSGKKIAEREAAHARSIAEHKAQSAASLNAIFGHKQTIEQMKSATQTMVENYEKRIADLEYETNTVDEYFAHMKDLIDY